MAWMSGRSRSTTAAYSSSRLAGILTPLWRDLPTLVVHSFDGNSHPQPGGPVDSKDLSDDRQN